MAKLKAHGQELLRLEREYTKINVVTNESTKYRETRSYRSDGHIMQKMAFWQTGSPYQQDSWYDWGWKLFKKTKKGCSITDIVAHLNAERATIETKGWKFQTEV